MALVYLEADGIGANDNWNLAAGANKFSAVNRPDDDGTTYIYFAAGGVPPQDLTLSAPPTGIIAINSVSAVMRALISNAAAPANEQMQMDLLLNGSTTSAITINTTDAVYGWATTTATGLARPGGGAWSVDDLKSLQIRLTGPYTSGASQVSVTTAYVLVDCVLSPARVGAAKDVGSRIVRLLRRPVSTVKITAPLRFADIELLDDIAITHFAGPTTSTSGGWGDATWQRRLIRVLGQEIDVGSATVNIFGLDVRDYLVSFWDTMVSQEVPTLPGNAKLDPGATRTYARTLNAWIENSAVAAQGSKQVVQLDPNFEKFDTYGNLLESSGTNEIIRSSFVAGTSGLTVAGTSGGGSAVVDTADLLFDSSITANSLKLTAGSPHTLDLTVQMPTTTGTIAANTLVTYSIDHKDDSGVALNVRLQRVVDSFWWSHATNAWTSVSTNNALTVRTTSIERDQLPSIDVGTSATRLTPFLVLTASGTAGRANHVYHAQIEQRRYASSRIVVNTTTSTTGARSADDLKVENFHGRRTWPLDHGTAYLQFIPEWNSSELASGVTRPLLEAYYDDSNYERLFWDQATTGVIFRRRLAGTNYDAVKTGALTRGTNYEIAARWTGTDEEEGLGAYTVSVFVDGTKGTDAIPGSIPNSITSTGYLKIGSDTQAIGSPNYADGWIKHLMITPFVLSDLEIGDLP